MNKALDARAEGRVDHVGRTHGIDRLEPILIPRLETHAPGSMEHPAASRHGLLQRHDVRPLWVRGHDGHPRNEYANHLATTAAKDQSASGGLVDSGFTEWLDAEREKDNYLDFMEFVKPEV